MTYTAIGISFPETRQDNQSRREAVNDTAIPASQLQTKPIHDIEVDEYFPQQQSDPEIVPDKIVPGEIAPCLIDVEGSNPAWNETAQMLFELQTRIQKVQRQSFNDRIASSRTEENARASRQRRLTRSSTFDLGVTPLAVASGNAVAYEDFSGLHLSKRNLPHTVLEEQFRNKSVLRIPDLLKRVVGPSWELPEADGDFVVFGIVASKSQPKEKKAPHNLSDGTDDWEKKWETGSNNESKYMVITLTDLTWDMDLYLFSTAFTRHHRLVEGTVVAILNPGIMPPPPKKANTNRFSLTLNSSDDDVLNIGIARDMGYCKAMKKDGKECLSHINASKTEFCDWHLDAQIRKTQASRMGVNTGSAMFGPGGADGSRYTWSRNGNFRVRRRGGERERSYGNGLKTEGQQYDKWNKTTYFVAPAGPARSANHTENVVARRGENTEALMQKRLVAQAKEREINRKLGNKSDGGLGAEYARVQESNLSPSKRRRDVSGQDIGRKRARFVTDRVP